MRIIPGFVSVALLLVCAVHPIRAQQQTHQAEEKSAIRTLIQKTEDANNAGDVEGWVRLFADDAVYMAPSAPPVTTREDLIEVAKAGFRHQASIDIEPVEIQVCGDWAFARTQVSGNVKLHGTGEVVPVDVKQIVIYSREPGGDWRIARFISNSNTE